MNESAVSQNEFSKKLKKGWNNTKTFFGVPANSLLVFFGILLLVLNIVPIFSVLIDSFTVHEMENVPDGMGGFLIAGDWTGYHYYDLFASETSVGYFWKPFGNSLLVSCLSCAFAILIGGIAAYLVCRTNMPFKKFISAIFIFPYIMPQWTLALFWKNLFINDQIAGGYVGEWQALFGQAVPSWWVYGAFPISLVMGLHYAPFAYILIGGVLRNMDSNLEEAATILNIPKWKVFTKVTIPMIQPALMSTILLVFSAAMSSYPVAQTLGSPVNFYVLAVRMKSFISGSGGAKIGIGTIISIVLIVIGVLILMLNQMQTSGRKQFTTVTGKSGQVSKKNLGKVGRWVVGAIACLFVVFFCIGPMVSFALESMVPNPGDYSSGLTLRYWTSSEVIRNDIHGVFYEEKLWSSLKNSFVISICCSLLAGTSGLLIGYAVAKKRKSKLANAVNGLAFFPYLLPSISLSAIFFILSMNVSFLYATPILVCVILGTMKYIPFASRSSLNAMMQLSNEIEEAAIIQNVPWVKRMGRVIFPIQKSAFISGYLLPFISCMREYNLFAFIGGNDVTLTRYMYFLEDTGIAALENAANLILVVIILVCNWLVTLLTGASVDKGIGGK